MGQEGLMADSANFKTFFIDLALSLLYNIADYIFLQIKDIFNLSGYLLVKKLGYLTSEMGSTFDFTIQVSLSDPVWIIFVDN